LEETWMKVWRGLALVISAVFSFAAASAAPAADRKPVRVLVYSGSTGYRHASIEPGVAAIKAMAGREGFSVTTSEDPAVFTDANLKNVDVLLLLSNSTNPKDPASEWFVGERRTALQNFVHRGGGVVGVHAASDSHYSWPWYGQMIGGHFARHPKGTPEGEVRIFDPKHPSTQGLPTFMRRVDEWYYFDDYDPRSHLLATVDPASIGEADANPNPVSWAREFEGGRVFYTALGHTPEAYQDANFLKHLAGGVRWAAKR